MAQTAKQTSLHFTSEERLRYTKTGALPAWFPSVVLRAVLNVWQSGYPEKHTEMELNKRSWGGDIARFLQTFSPDEMDKAVFSVAFANQWKRYASLALALRRTGKLLDCTRVGTDERVHNVGHMLYTLAMSSLYDYLYDTHVLRKYFRQELTDSDIFDAFTSVSHEPFVGLDGFQKAEDEYERLAQTVARNNTDQR